MSLTSIILLVIALLCAIISVIAVPVPLDVVDNIISVAEDALSSNIYTTWSHSKLESLFNSSSETDYKEETPSNTESTSEEVVVPTPDNSASEEPTAPTPDYSSSEEPTAPVPEDSTPEEATTDYVPRCPYH